MRELTPEEYQDVFKKILPHLNSIIEISQRFFGDDVEFVVRFDTDGTFCFMPPYPEPMLCRDEDEEFPRFVDKYGLRHKLVRKNGRVIWVVASKKQND